MKKTALLVLISIFLLGCNLPFTITLNNTASPQVQTSLPVTETPTIGIISTESPATIEVPTSEPLNGVELNLGGVYMILPACMATSANGTLVPAAPYDEMNGPMEYYPENRKITFSGYPLSGKFFEPYVVVYPVAQFVDMNQSIADRVSAMQTLLTSKPAAPDGIPLLPVFNAAQMFSTNEKYLNFQNGEGIRFLTEYSQYSAPVNNYDLFYTFQGMTSDGQYWISAILPVNTAILQESPDAVNVPAGGILAPSMDDPNYSAAMEAYYPAMLTLLNSTPDANFTPALDCLDQYIQSLNIGG